jgi:hypothetical protein
VRSIPGVIDLLMLAFTTASTAALFLKGSSASKMAQGEVRCEGSGAVVINIAGHDYAVSGMASRRYPPIQRVWNATAYPKSGIDRIIVRGASLFAIGDRPLEL